MHAIVARQFGGPEVLALTEVPDPDLGPGDVLVRVEIAGITFVETQFRASGRGPFPIEPPYTPGNGVGGTVTAVGADVDDSLIGRRVVTTTGGTGGYAEQVAVAAAGLIDVPDQLDLATAVALLADGRTAMALVDAVDIEAGSVVLIEAAAGGVGTLLVQMAKTAGARVIAAAGGERKLAVVRDLGADLAVDYLDPGWAEVVRAEVGNVDIVFDGVGGDLARAAFELVGRGGRMISFGGASGQWGGLDADLAAERDVTLLGLPRPSPAETRALTERALADAVAGRLRPVIGQRFALERAADAHRAIEDRASIGKTLLDVAGAP